VGVGDDGGARPADCSGVGLVRDEASGDRPCGGTDSDDREDAGGAGNRDEPDDWGDCADTVISGP
jgi:hypothetical protein